MGGERRSPGHSEPADARPRGGGRDRPRAPAGPGRYGNRARKRGSYARTTPDRYGFPRLARARQKRHHGFATGDLVHASVSKGKWAGTWTGRISVRASGKHSLSTPVGRCTVSHRNLRPLQRADGYAYSYRQEVTE
ncbi:hypothetical protein SAMN02745898_112109 [Streptomyces sp. 136MFCol5.1]|uniref:hypothetical protein n=1 Tax=Streptomyces sp. 136MFCol5.1 TaxID=1172182 RepID=UPI000887C043|nr:hypothetical protein [Streptomyces sp. 136MFCol5.1]SCZ14448.1 hypothetical protein SAMN02745898_112109 [Streptomyces sp. 136MFCol5.1]SFT30681.1 hypothetical protein SAMN04487982_11668 [Streptomyces sp. ok210]